MYVLIYIHLCIKLNLRTSEILNMYEAFHRSFVVFLAHSLLSIYSFNCPPYTPASTALLSWSKPYQQYRTNLGEFFSKSPFDWNRIRVIVLRWVECGCGWIWWLLFPVCSDIVCISGKLKNERNMENSFNWNLFSLFANTFDCFSIYSRRYVVSACSLPMFVYYV